MFGQRARSASDASVLRRKGHLKEQDQMIEFLLQMHVTHTSMETMVKMERWIEQHRKVGLACVQPCYLACSDTPPGLLQLQAFWACTWARPAGTQQAFRPFRASARMLEVPSMSMTVAVRQDPTWVKLQRLVGNLCVPA